MKITNGVSLPYVTSIGETLPLLKKFRVLLLNARTQPSFDQTDDGVDAETSLSLSLHFYLSSPPLHFFLALTIGHYILFENACELQRVVFHLEELTIVGVTTFDKEALSIAVPHCAQWI